MAEPEPLTFKKKKAFEVAEAIETTKRDTKDLVVVQGHSEVHRVQRVPSKAVTRQTNLPLQGET